MKTRHSLSLLAALALVGTASAQTGGADFSMNDVVVPPAGSATTAGDAVSVEDAAPQRVDVFVAFTPAARAYAGSAAAMKAAINTYVAATNTAYTNSDINVVLKLVGTAEVSYTETSSFSTDLSRLASTTDAYLTTVPGLRETYKADLVALIRRNDAGGVAGIGYLGNLTSGFAPNAYSVTADIWAVGNNAFPHELGHNYGCHHDHANGSGAARVYAYGHRFNGTNGTQYRTVMAYAPGARIPYFSNPSISYQGTATGVSGTGGTAADNARLIEESSVVTRTFRNGGTRLTGLRVGNLNNSGTADLVLSDEATGERYAWIMSGTTRSSAVALPTMSTTWSVAALADFNADGKVDIVWDNVASGAKAIWLMNGTARSSTVDLPTMSVSWRIAGAGDLNADGKPDLVWDNTASGAKMVWLMNGTARASSVDLPVMSVSWRIGAVADFNADNKPDLVWDNTASGAKMIWLMNGTTRTSTVALATMSVSWRVVGAADFNGDAKPDIVWENSASRARNIWTMNGTTRIATVNLPTPHFN